MRLFIKLDHGTREHRYSPCEALRTAYGQLTVCQGLRGDSILLLCRVESIWIVILKGRCVDHLIGLVVQRDGQWHRLIAGVDDLGSQLTLNDHSP